VSERTLSVLDGSTFVVSDRLGDVRADEGREHGFFSDDTRFISRWVLRAGTAPLVLLSLDQASYFDARFFLTPSVGPEDQAPSSVVRRRLIDHVWIEEIVITNHLHDPSRTTLTVEIDTDFADLFEVKDGAVSVRDVACELDDHSVTLTYELGDFRRSVTITSSERAVTSRLGFEYILDLAPGAQWSTTLTVTPWASQQTVTFARRATRGTIEALGAMKSAELEAWLASAPALESELPAVARLRDFAILRSSAISQLTNRYIFGSLSSAPHLHTVLG